MRGEERRGGWVCGEKEKGGALGTELWICKYIDRREGGSLVMRRGRYGGRERERERERMSIRRDKGE